MDRTDRRSDLDKLSAEILQVSTDSDEPESSQCWLLCLWLEIKKL